MNRKIYMVIVLLVLSVISSGALAYVYQSTAERIELEYRNDFIRSLDIVLPEYYNDPYNDILTIDNRSIHLAKDENGEVIGYAISGVSDKGYSGKVSVIVGVDIAGKITGVCVLKHAETPGLGSNIEKDYFLSQYLGLTDSKEIMISKDGGSIETITGATISPRAVSFAVKDAIEFLKKSLIKEGGYD